MKQKLERAAMAILTGAALVMMVRLAIMIGLGFLVSCQTIEPKNDLSTSTDWEKPGRTILPRNLVID